MEEVLKAFAYTGDGVWAVDMDQRIVLWNAAAETMLGIAAADALGRHCYELLEGRDSAGALFCRTGCPVVEAVKGGRLVRSFGLQVQGNARRWADLDVSVVVPVTQDQGPRPQVLVALFRLLAEVETEPPPLRIGLLGPIQVQRGDGSQVEGRLWRRGKVRALLAFLALRRGRPVHRDLVLDALWPDLDYPKALHNLNTTVYYLRRCLEPALARGADSSYVQIEGDCYLLVCGEAHWLDIEVFETGLTQARRETDPARAKALYRSALGLYRGDFLADLDRDLLDCWMERERLSQLYLNGLEELAALCAEERQDRKARDLFLKVLALDPCRESAAQHLMHLALRQGQRSAALACYQRLERALWRELEVLPSPESRVLFDMAVQGGQALPPAPQWAGLEPALRVG